MFLASHCEGLHLLVVWGICRRTSLIYSLVIMGIWKVPLVPVHPFQWQI